MFDKILRQHGWALLLILAVYLLTLWIRVPYLDRRLSDHHEWLTAENLMVLDIWFEQGIWDSRFAQRMNYNREADKFINNASMSNRKNGYPHDDEGNYYYMSYPSFSLIVPYAIFKLTGRKPNTRNLQQFNLGIHLTCALLIYILVTLVADSRSRIDGGAVLSASIYLMLPNLMWFHSNTYHIDMFAQLPFLSSTLCAYLYFREWKGSPSNHRLLFLLGLLVFLFCFTEWMGFLFAFVVFLYSLFKLRESKVFLKPALVMCIAVFSAIAVFVLQHASLIGFDGFFQYIVNQGKHRVGMSAETDLEGIVDFGRIYRHIYEGTSPLWLLLIALFFANRHLDFKPLVNKYGLVLLLLFVPPTMHHLLLLNFTTIHDYSIIRSMCWFAVVFGLLWNEMARNREFEGVLRTSVISVVIIVSTWMCINRYYGFTWNPSGGNYFHMGKIARLASDKGEVVFTLGSHPPRPQTLYYAKRNIQWVSSLEEAKQWLKNSPGDINKGMLIIDYLKHQREYFTVEK